MATKPTLGESHWGSTLNAFLEEKVLTPVLLLEQGQPVPEGTPIGTIVFERI